MNLLSRLISPARRCAALPALAVLLMAIGLCGSARAVPTFSLAPSTVAASPGGIFTLDLLASGVDQGIGGWSFGVTVADGAVASLTGIRFSGALGAIGSQALGFGDSMPGGFPPTSGTQTFEFGVASLLSSTDLAGLQGTSFKLATLSFVARAAGDTEVSLAMPAIGAALSDAAGNAVSVGLPMGAAPSISVSVSVSVPAPVSPVPEPATGALLLSGLACLGVASRARRR